MGNAKSHLNKSAHETRWLDLSDTKIKYLPEDILPISPTVSITSKDSPNHNKKQVANIEGLSLSHNMLTLTDDLGKLTTLEYLDLSHCNLLTLHRSVAQLINLKELILYKNSLSAIPPLPHSLEKLDLSYNMVLNLPEQLSTLPNLYFVNLEGNPCVKRVKHLVLQGRAKSGTFQGKAITFEKLRFNDEEVAMIGEVFDKLVNPKDGLIPLDNFKRRMGLGNVSDSTFVDSMFRVFEQFGSRNEFDIRAFLLGLGVLFKGTVEEKSKFCFDLFDLNYDGIVELQDILDVVKSSVLSAIHIAQFCKEEYEQDNVDVHVNEFDFGLRIGNKSYPALRADMHQEKFIQTIFAAHWPAVKEAITRRFKEMDKQGKGKVAFKEFARFNFTQFAELNQFLTFYASLVSYGPELKLE